MIGKSLVKAVHKEAAELFKNAAQEEKDRLDFEGFNPNRGTNCIYGQMAHECRSARAIELLTECAPFAIKTESQRDDVACRLTHEAKEFYAKTFYCDRWSPIEVYIAQDGADNAQLIAYLKGECDTLDLSPTINC